MKNKTELNFHSNISFNEETFDGKNQVSSIVLGATIFSHANISKGATAYSVIVILNFKLKRSFKDYNISSNYLYNNIGIISIQLSLLFKISNVFIGMRLMKLGLELDVNLITAMKQLTFVAAIAVI